jgi:rubredoxin
MVRRYYEKRSLSIKTVEIFECPDCGFEFNAIHEADEQVGGWECPLCEADELNKRVKALETANDLLHMENQEYEKALKEIAESNKDSSCNELALRYEVIADKALND